MTRTLPTLILLLVVLTAAAASRAARADDCSGRTVHTYVAPGATWSVELRWSDGGQPPSSPAAKGWQRRFVQAGRPGAWHPLPGFGAHAHLVVFVSARAPFFAVLDSSAEHHLDGRMLVFESFDGIAPARSRSLSLAQLLTPAELAQVTRSISHIHWLGENDPPYSFAPDGTTLRIQVVSGRTLSIPLVPVR